MTRVAIIVPTTDERPLAPEERFVIAEMIPSQIWETARAIVGGDDSGRSLIEILRITEPGENPDPRPFSQGWHLALYLNEEGLLINLPLNILVTTERGYQVPIVGAVIISCHRVDGEGETIYRDLSDEDIKLIKRRIRLAVPG